MRSSVILIPVFNKISLIPLYVVNQYILNGDYWSHIEYYHANIPVLLFLNYIASISILIKTNVIYQWQQCWWSVNLLNIFKWGRVICINGLTIKWILFISMLLQLYFLCNAYDICCFSKNKFNYNMHIYFQLWI